MCQFHPRVDSLTAVDLIDRFSPQADWKLAHASIAVICSLSLSLLFLQHCSRFPPNAANLKVKKNNNKKENKKPRQAFPTLSSDPLPSFSLRDVGLSQMAYGTSFHITSCQLAWDQGFSLTPAKKAFQTQKKKEGKKNQRRDSSFLAAVPPISGAKLKRPYKDTELKA